MLGTKLLEAVTVCCGNVSVWKISEWRLIYDAADGGEMLETFHVSH